MTLAADQFRRRFLLPALPRGFPRIRHYGLLASARRKDHLERARRLLSVAPPPPAAPINEPEAPPLCPCFGGPTAIRYVSERLYLALAPPPAPPTSGTPAPFARTAPSPPHPPPPCRAAETRSRTA